MKNIVFKKIISILVVAFILLSTTPVVFAYSDFKTEFVEGEYIDFTDESISSQAQKYLTSIDENALFYSAYSLLTDEEKVYYNSIVNIEPGTMTFKIEYNPLLTKEEYEAIDFTAIMYAVTLDHPEIFYYNGYSYSRSYYSSTGEVASITYNLVSPKVSGSSTAVYPNNTIVTKKAQLDTAISNVSLDTSSRYNFVLSLHDYLCNTVDYVNNGKSCFDAYGTLVEKKAVCQGYAETFKLFCNLYNIPSVCLTGTANGGPHMWNAVQMEDGNWYFIDATWDDQNSYIFYDFFLIGSQTTDLYFTRLPFASSHLSDGSPYLPQLKYSNEKYVAKETTGFEANRNCLADTEEKQLLLSPYDINDNTVIYYKGMPVDVNGFYTGSTFIAGNEEWEIVVMGDCNGDGNVDTTDYSLSINLVLSDTNVYNSDYDPYVRAADICTDGYLDVLDVFVLQLGINDLRRDWTFE